MPNGTEFYTNKLGGSMWVFDPGSLPPWRNLSSGQFSNTKPSGADEKFTPSGPFTQEEAQMFPYAGQYIQGFPSATGTRAVTSPAPITGLVEGAGQVPPPPVSPAGPSTAGQVPALDAADFWVKVNEFGDTVPAREGETGAVFDFEAWTAANKAMHDLSTGFDGGGGRTGPTAAELAIQQSQVDAQNLATFVDSTINQLSGEIEAGRLKTEQAVAEFNRRLDAFSEAGEQFKGIQPYTIPIGAEYAPGFQPGGIGERLGIDPRRAEVIQFDPFQMAADIVAGTPNIADIGVPETDLLSEAVEIARGFI